MTTVSVVGSGVMATALTFPLVENGHDVRLVGTFLAREIIDTIRAIGGPSIAGEVVVRRDTCVVFTGRDAEVLEKLAAIFRTDYYHVWTSTDFIGVEVC